LGLTEASYSERPETFIKVSIDPSEPTQTRLDPSVSPTKLQHSMAPSESGHDAADAARSNPAPPGTTEPQREDTDSSSAPQVPSPPKAAAGETRRQLSLGPSSGSNAHWSLTAENLAPRIFFVLSALLLLASYIIFAFPSTPPHQVTSEICSCPTSASQLLSSTQPATSTAVPNITMSSAEQT
jgi:hypothetical protein